jgi:hypothetical protein
MQGIPDDTPTDWGRKKLSEITESCPRTPEYTTDRIVPLKGNNYAVHGTVPEKEEVGQGKKYDDIKLPMFFQFFDIQHYPILF